VGCYGPFCGETNTFSPGGDLVATWWRLALGLILAVPATLSQHVPLRGSAWGVMAHFAAKETLLALVATWWRLGGDLVATCPWPYSCRLRDSLATRSTLGKCVGCYGPFCGETNTFSPGGDLVATWWRLALVLILAVSATLSQHVPFRGSAWGVMAHFAAKKTLLALVATWWRLGGDLVATCPWP
jgi:hypothetical protein